MKMERWSNPPLYTKSLQSCCNHSKLSTVVEGPSMISSLQMWWSVKTKWVTTPQFSLISGSFKSLEIVKESTTLKTLKEGTSKVTWCLRQLTKWISKKHPEGMILLPWPTWFYTSWTIKICPDSKVKQCRLSRMLATTH